jgi:SAM-dependent methyltransferase
MPDAIFAEPRLAEIYDLLDSPDRPDLAPYLAIADEFNAHSVIDLGCGTGVFACRLVALGREVVGIDPTAASLDVAKDKAYADRVRWITGTAAQLEGWHANLITMTGNVAQVFVTDEEWMAALRACRAALSASGRLVFEVRDSAKEAWKGWNRELSYLGSGRRPHPFRAGDACRLACRRASDVPYCLLAPCQLHRVWACHGQSFPWVKARTCLGRGARSLSGAAHATSPVLNENNVLAVGRHSLGARP